MASISNSVVNQLLTLGADAMSNMYDVVLTLPANTAAGQDISSDQLKFRCKDFKPPVASVQTYDFSYKTVSIKKVATKIELDRTFDLTFILDSNFQVYKTLKHWAGQSHIGSSGLVYSDTYGTDQTGIVTIKSLAESYKRDTTGLAIAGVNTVEEFNNVLSWTYKNVLCTKVSEPEFSTGDAAALEITATFVFGEYEDPASDVL